MRLEVGRGLEGVITDGTAGEILDAYLVPARANYEKTGDLNFSKAFEDTVVLIGSKIGYDGSSISKDGVSQSQDGLGETTAPAGKSNVEDSNHTSGIGSFIGYFIAIPIIATLALAIFIARKRRRRGPAYLFTWENVPSDPQEETKLRQYISNFAPWALNATITKSNNGNTIFVTGSHNAVEDGKRNQASISIDSNETTASLLISGGHTPMAEHDQGALTIRKNKKNGKRRVYIQTASLAKQSANERRKRDRRTDDRHYPGWGAGTSGGWFSGGGGGGSGFSGGGGSSGGAGAGR